MSQTISLSQTAIQKINEILSRGKGVEVAVRNGRLVVWELNSKKQYEVVIPR